jgi:hypothetical protein
MSLLSKYMPKASGIRDPRSKSKKNGIFWNYPRFLYIGGAPGTTCQVQDKAPDMGPYPGQNAVGPISDRGKGRG